MVVAGMLSGKGENLPFFQAVPLHGPLELWMSKVEAEMYLAVRNRAKQVGDPPRACISLHAV